MQNLKHHKFALLENFGNGDNEISASRTQRVNIYEAYMPLQFLREKPLRGQGKSSRRQFRFVDQPF